MNLSRGQSAASKARSSKAAVDEPVSYCRTFPGQWPGVQESVYATVQPYRGWLASCQLFLPNLEREQWNTTRRFESRDDAAAYAAAFIMEAERILAALEAGGEPYMPHRAMREECMVAVASDPALRRIRREREYETKRGDFEVAWYRARDFRNYVLTFDVAKEAA